VREFEYLNDKVAEMAVKTPADGREFLLAFLRESFIEVFRYNFLSIAWKVIKQNKEEVGKQVQDP
jgi:hypothetical protein